MYNKSKISNPLTVIAIFAGIAEVSGTITLANIPSEIQLIFVWFVMIFPILLVLLFFLVLMFKSKALYAPCDFKNEQNYVDLFKSSPKISSSSNEGWDPVKTPLPRICNPCIL